MASNHQAGLLTNFCQVNIETSLLEIVYRFGVKTTLDISLYLLYRIFIYILEA